MKLTNDQLKQIIREELSKLSETADTLEEETADQREDHNIDDLYAMARENRKALNKLLKKADMDELEIED